MKYTDYISSPAWRDSPARLAELQAAGYRCRICDAGRDEARLEVHHRTYERLGHEVVSDLTALCSECHVAVTDLLRRRRYAGRRLTVADHQSEAARFIGLGELLKKGGRP